jgi:hypothetical protein
MPPGNPASGGTASGVSVDVKCHFTERASMDKEKLDWRRSIVDLMKLLNLDSSLTARKQLAQELHYTGDMNDSATMASPRPVTLIYMAVSQPLLLSLKCTISDRVCPATERPKGAK